MLISMHLRATTGLPLPFTLSFSPANNGLVIHNRVSKFYNPIHDPVDRPGNKPICYCFLKISKILAWNSHNESVQNERLI